MAKAPRLFPGPQHDHRACLAAGLSHAEAVCAVRFREQDANGNYSGGPMYYIKNGLHKRWHWLGVAFAIFGGLAGFGIANTVQSNFDQEPLGDENFPAKSRNV